MLRTTYAFIHFAAKSQFILSYPILSYPILKNSSTPLSM